MYDRMHVFRLQDAYGSQLWTREVARKARAEMYNQLEELKRGESLVIDASGVEVFDFSFANEFFGKTVINMPSEFPDRFVIVENLSKYARENLEMALIGLDIAMLLREGGELRLIGEAHRTERETFDAIAKTHGAVTSIELKARLGINLTAANERLSKLSEAGLIYRRKGLSSAGREQYEYQVPQ